MQFLFGTGQIFTMPVGGGAPVKFGSLQDVSVDISGDIKELYGQYQFPLDVARGKTKIEGKAGNGNVDVDFFNSVFFGSGTSTGEKKQAFNEAGTIPTPSGPYTISVANSANFVMDLGVVDATTGVQLKQVASGPTTGQYSVAAGVYTFAAADAGKGVLITYLYSSASTGKTMNITNALMGNTPKFQLVLSEQYNSKFYTMVLYSCTSSKFSLPLKQDNYGIPEFSFSAQANDAGQIGYITTTG